MIFDLPKTFETKENAPTGSNDSTEPSLLLLKEKFMCDL